MLQYHSPYVSIFLFSIQLSEPTAILCQYNFVLHSIIKLHCNFMEVYICRFKSRPFYGFLGSLRATLRFYDFFVTKPIVNYPFMVLLGLHLTLFYSLRDSFCRELLIIIIREACLNKKREDISQQIHQQMRKKQCKC
jgi:hypothetical protein